MATRIEPNYQLYLACVNHQPQEHNILLFHVFLSNLRDAVSNFGRGWGQLGVLDGSQIDNLKWTAYLIEIVITFIGGRCLEGKFGYHTYNLRRRKLNGGVELRALWDEKWTTALKTKIERYRKTIFRLIEIWMIEEKIGTLASFRVRESNYFFVFQIKKHLTIFLKTQLFLKAARLLQFLVLKTMKMNYDPRRVNLQRVELCGCVDCLQGGHPYAYCLPTSDVLQNL